jgi:CPA1 family monovalent cation:H+ antiporter
LETIAIILVLLLAVVASGAIARISRIPAPLPLVQIALGAAMDAFGNLGVELKPDIFFLLFLPPLLFLDGWRIPKESMARDKTMILELAFGLVIFTVVGVGFFVHWLIPAMPLAVAFALAAILSPTDPLAVTAIAARVPIPHRMMHILEAEALLNDASGLVCMRFAVAAVLTGTFSLANAAGTFVWLALGGIVIGVVVTRVTVLVKNWISRKFGEESGSEILISLLIPFGAYLLAEEAHASGILAAVSAGIAMSFAEAGGQALASTRIRRNVVWDTIAFAANGIIFVILGEQLPQIVMRAERVVHDTGHHETIWLLGYVVAITAALAVLRFIWVWTSLRFTLFRRGQGGGFSRPQLRVITAISLAGVRGAITLAGVLTLPLALNSGAEFPSRGLAIFLAAGVIIASLITASIGLPRLLKGLELPPDTEHQEQEDRARIAAAEAAITAIEQKLHEESDDAKDAEVFTDAGARVMAMYRQRIDGRSKSGEEAVDARKRDKAERSLRLAGVRAERDEIFRRARMRLLSDDTARSLVRELDLAETRLSAG